MFSSRVPGSGPTMRISGKLEFGFDFFLSRYVVVAPAVLNFFQRASPLASRFADALHTLRTWREPGRQ
ncbi:hypothetical protein GQ600_4611 [Phytophthora cactorum]|nr:hypothetical protein GQ600_4611 [Phytophthora cactorum]